MPSNINNEIMNDYEKIFKLVVFRDAANLSNMFLKKFLKLVKVTNKNTNKDY